MAKVLTVFGATGNQGGSVIKHILADPQLSKEFTIRGVTRDKSRPAAQALAKQGVELVVADLNSKESITSAIEGSHTVFLVTNYWETADPKVELSQGKNVADVAKQVGVQHMIFSSLLNVTEASGGKLTHVPHFDGKAEIEQYIRKAGFPFTTFILPGYFMSNYQQMLQKQDDSTYMLAYPVSKESKFPLFDPDDAGLFLIPALKRPESFNGKQLLAATDYYTVDQIVADFEAATDGKKKIVFAQITPEQYKSYLPPVMAEEMLENHLFIESPGYYDGRSLEETLSALEQKPTSWKEYARKHFA